MLTAAAKLKPRTRPIERIILHTTSRAFAKRVAPEEGPPTIKGAVARYERTGHPYFGHWLIDPQGKRVQLADESRRAVHTASLDRRYQTEDWMAWGAPGGVKTWTQHGRDPETVFDWWLERWPEFRSPLEMVSRRHVNGVSIGIDLMPLPSGIFTIAQMGALKALLLELCERCGLEYSRDVILAHEDVDPVRRGTVKRRGGKIFGVGWDPGSRLDWGALGLA
jgi:hypothetical protein